MIIVDGRNSGKEISNFANLEEILVDVMEDEGMENRVVTDVLVNNEQFSEIYPHQAEDISTASITSVEVRSVEASEMALAIAGEMEKVALMMEKAAHEIARLFREASNTDALELLQDLLDVNRDFMSMLALLDVIRSYAFREQIDALGGYGTARTGEVIWEYPGRPAEVE